MASSPLQLAVRTTASSATSTIVKPPCIQEFASEIGGFDELSDLTAVVLCVEQRKSSKGLQDRPWNFFLANPTHWWNKSCSKPSCGLLNVQHNAFFLWLDDRHSAWIDAATWGAGVKEPADSATSFCSKRGAFSSHNCRSELEMCSELCANGRVTEAVDALTLLVGKGCHVHNNFYYHMLKGCMAIKDLSTGRRIHDLTIKSGYEEDAFLATHLIGLYASHGRLEEAMEVFLKVPTPSSQNWATIMFAYARRGNSAQVMRLYRQMRDLAIQPHNQVYVAVLKACAAAGDLVAGKEVHAHILANPGKPGIFVQTGLLAMYARCGSLEDARKVFDKLPERDVVTWNAMIAGYAQQGLGQKALSLYLKMQQEGLSQPDSATFTSLLQACASLDEGAIEEGKQLHSQIEERGLKLDVVLGNSLLNMYAKCGSLEDARAVFDRLPVRDVVSWNTMISGYAQQGMGQEALQIYSMMQQEALCFPNSVTFTSLLQACASAGVGALHEGKQLHVKIKEQGLQKDPVLAGSLVNMYAKCGNLEDARNLFDLLPVRDIVTWTTLIAGYVQRGMGHEALSLYSSMQLEGLNPPNIVTYVCLLQACAGEGVEALRMGKQLHTNIRERGLQNDIVIGGSLVNMYAKCGSLEDARSVFDRLQSKNVVTWNVMLTGYVRQGMSQEGLALFSNMQLEGLTPPNSVTYVCMLQACAALAALPRGKQLHAEIQTCGMQADVVVGAALVNMYAKCGSMHRSQKAFEALPERTVEAWGALLAGYAHQGSSTVVFDLLDRMKQEGIEPDGITFLSVLTLCSHVGLVETGRRYFQSMKTDYSISANIEHYTCMVDLLGRAGHLHEALEMAKTMPFQPNDILWHTLLGACWKWKNVEIGQQAFEGAMSVDKNDASSYVLLANIYASANMWEAAKDLQAKRKNLGAWKKPGQSWWTDMEGVVHTFIVGDKRHPASDRIYARLEQIVPKMKKEGYVPLLQSSLRNLSDDEKEADLCGHSERLAIAHALNETPEGATIRIAKNLRVCADCHTAISYISKVEKRTIICRDASRFHVYKDGKCSCGDYW